LLSQWFAADWSNQGFEYCYFIHLFYDTILTVNDFESDMFMIMGDESEMVGGKVFLAYYNVPS
jgi:hypothetical protein